MFPRVLLLLPPLFCILCCQCYAQETEKPTRRANETTISESMILSAAMVCSMFTVLIVLVPTLLYYRYYSKEKDEIGQH